MKNKLKVALIGHGKMGALLAQNIAVHPGFELSAICDANPAIKDGLPYPSTTFTTHADDVLRDPSVDVVVIATLPDSHYALAKAALEAGKHVLVEKPIAQSVKQAEDLAALAKAKGRVLLVDHTLLYEEAAQKIQYALANETYGKPAQFEFTRIQRQSPTLSERSCFEELAPHVFSVLDMLDNYQSNRATITYLRGDLTHGVRADVKMESGLQGTLHFEFRKGLSAKDEQRRTIVTFHPKKLDQHSSVTHRATWDERRDDGTNQQTITISDAANGIKREIKTGREFPLSAVMSDLHESITQKREPRSNGQTSIRVMQMMEGVVQSQKSGGQSVTVDLAPLKMTAPARVVVM